MQFNEEFILLSNTPFGDVQIRYYGIIIVAAMLVAATIAARLAKRTNRDPDHIWGALTWAIFPGIIFARLWFVLFPTVSSIESGRTTLWYFQNFFDLQNGAIAIWSGGLSIFGAVLGGFLGAWLYFSRYHNPISRFFHVIFLPISAVFEAIAWVFVAIYQRVRGKEVQPYRLPKFESEFPAEGMDMAPCWILLVWRCRWRRQSGAGQTSSIRNCTACRLTCPGVSRLMLNTAWGFTRVLLSIRWRGQMRHASTPCSCTNRSGIWWRSSCC